VTAELDPGALPPDPAVRVPLSVEKVLIAAAMAAMALITFANVVVRYLSNISLAFTEEYSVALMVIIALLGTGLATATGRHIRIGYFVDSRSPAVRRGFELGALALVLLMFGILLVWGAEMAFDEYRYEIMSSGLGLPQWWYSIWLPLLSLAVMVRALGRMVRLARGEDG
jgi:TRAP-type C4-dicarboxylate transport system permease small subunit